MFFIFIFVITSCNNNKINTAQNATIDDNISIDTTLIPKTVNSGQISESLQFGGYDWRILDIHDNYALIIVTDIISRREFHHTLEPITTVTWENSDIRYYLNTDFYLQFSDEERTRIRPTTVTTTTNNSSWFNTHGGNDTTDKIFLLSIEELDKYFADDSNKMTTRGNRETSWWLRCTQRSGAANMFYDHDGIFDFFKFTHSSGVRPALWLNIELK
jgi:hypothetical protein